MHLRLGVQIRKDWDQVKEQVMYKVLKIKFHQHPDLKYILLGTGNKTIVEDSPFDYFWGCGKNRTGKNRLGCILMRLRTEFKLEVLMEEAEKKEEKLI
jgi:hypothetical protein